METSRSAEGPFSPGWQNKSTTAAKTPNSLRKEEAVSAVKNTPTVDANTPKCRQTSPKSEFGYDDAYSVGGEEFADTAAVRKSRTVTRRRSPKAKRFQKAKQAFLAPTSCSTVKQRSKVTAEVTKAIPVPDTASKHEVKQATVPISPHFRTRAASKNKAQPLTSDDLLFQKLEKERAEEAERIAKAKKLYTMLKTRASRRSSKLYGKVIPESATKAAKPVPIRKQFNQPRKVPAAKESAAQPSTVKKGPGGLTLVEPFHFATDKRLPVAAETPDPVRTLTTAELAQNFMKDSRSHGAPATAAQRLTVGQSPKLRTQKRGQFAAKKPKPPTLEEKVAAEMDEINRHPFKARRLDRRIFESAGELGVPKVAARPVTEPVEFDFRADKRSAQPRVRASTASASLSPTKRSTTSFKAKPAPKTVSKMPAPRSKTVFKPTIAMSPKFNGGARASIAPPRRQRAPFNPAASLETAPVGAGPLKVTEPKEFKFASDNRGEYRRQQLEKQKAAEEQALAAGREVKAHPMPDFSKHVFHPDLQAHKAPPTETKPFQLRSALRHADAVSAFQQEALAITEQEKAAEFHARPVPQTTYKPDLEFVEPTDHTPVVPLPITLESERRALKRQEFDQVMGQKLAQLEVMQETIAKQKLDQENRRIQAMRRKSVEEGGLMFKAKPIVTKDQYPTKAVVSAPLTTPFSPQLRTKTRSSASGAVESMSSSGLLVETKKKKPSAGKILTSASTGKEEQQRAEMAQALSAM